MKKLITAFGMLYWDAPGEAEADCALLQKLKIVDYVWTEDADVFAFGGRHIIRNDKSSERNNIFNIQVYNADKIYTLTNLNCNGVILIALLNSGDYNTKGLLNCGIQTALAAAKLGYGDKLVKTKDYDNWRRSLETAIRENKGGYLSRRRINFVIENNFPDPNILGYYTSPVVSAESALKNFFSAAQWTREPDLSEIHAYTENTFCWTGIEGVLGFSRSISLPYLTWSLLYQNKFKNLRITIRGEKLTTDTAQIVMRRIELEPYSFILTRVSYIIDEVLSKDDSPRKDELKKKLRFWVPKVFFKNYEHNIVTQLCPIINNVTSEGNLSKQINELTQTTRRLSLEPTTALKEKARQLSSNPTKCSPKIYTLTLEDSDTEDELPRLEVITKGKLIRKNTESKFKQKESHSLKNKTEPEVIVVPDDSPTKPQKSDGKKVYLRKSLGGAWRENESDNGHLACYENVPVIDLTSL
ncbi:DNA repair endonuclease rad2 [Schizosaccharomyces japonicus yFS275]|uniref:DNA repair endonuclease rad2 n=1 Tax=Schizosaccharomyces japonicus (strain yFS275 / FY16936) TaxID=402676 RepID=B6K4W1_SCHJY|nr:DNA repair endonuclease rad2 [Schizosaccharomyces japonicus yFS275]EEB08518.2 DNA repair endonuclease rad2 [Schizosaccharomyces japonicus yFS275]